MKLQIFYLEKAEKSSNPPPELRIGKIVSRDNDSIEVTQIVCSQARTKISGLFPLD